MLVSLTSLGFGKKGAKLRHVSEGYGCRSFLRSKQMAVNRCLSFRKAEHPVSMAENVQLGASSFASRKGLVSQVSAAVGSAENTSLFTREAGLFKSRSLPLKDCGHADSVRARIISVPERGLYRNAFVSA